MHSPPVSTASLASTCSPPPTPCLRTPPTTAAPRPPPPPQPLPLPLRIRSGDLPLEGTVACAVDDQPRGRAAVRLDEAGQEAGIDLVLPGLSAGVHVLDLKLEPDDALDLDNRRSWVLATGALPPVLVV